MSKSWFGRLAAKVSGEKDASASASPRQSAPGSQRASAPPSSGPSRAASATPSQQQQQRRAEPEEELWEEPPFEAFVAQPQAPPAATAAPLPAADGEGARSPFHASAVAAASAGLMSPERVIDETTDLSTLTDQEITRLMEGMDGDVMNKPLITGPVPLLAIKAEYLRGSPQVLRKLEWLEQNGWDQIWRARGDGDCFYRSFTLAYLLRILYAPKPSEEAGAALTAIQATVPVMERVGFQSDILEEFIDPLINVIVSFIDPPQGQQPTEFTLLQLLQDAEKSNCIVVALRLMTGAHIRTHPDDFAPFLFSPVTLEPVSPDAFCREEVEPCGKEADHAQIMALASALAVPLRVAYLDRSDITGDDVINWVEFGEQKGSEEELRPLTLLYRPGHFDVVTKDHLMQAALAQTRHELADTPPAVPTPPPELSVPTAPAAAPVAEVPAAAHVAEAAPAPAAAPVAAVEAVTDTPPVVQAQHDHSATAVVTEVAAAAEPIVTETSEAPVGAPSEPAAATPHHHP